MNDVYVHLLDFPNTKVSETVTENADGSYSIFLNSKMSFEKQKDAYNHALGHIVNLDFEKTGMNIDVIEAYAHKK